MSPRRNADDVARHQLTRRRVDPLPIAFHPGLDRQLGLQGSDGVARLAFFPESDDGVGKKQKQDDAKIRPMPDDRRQNHRHFDHPRDGTPKIGEEFQEAIGFLFFNLVRPILGQPFLRLGLSEAIRRRPNFFSTSGRGRDFKSSFAWDFDLGPDSKALGWTELGCMMLCLLSSRVTALVLDREAHPTQRDADGELLDRRSRGARV